MEINEIQNMSETTFPSNCLDWRMSGQTLLDAQMKNQERVQPCQTLLNLESKPMYDLTSPKLNVSSNCIERVNDPDSISSHQSHSSSATIRTFHPEKDPNHLISTSPKSMLSERVSEIKENEKRDPELEGLTNYRTTLPLKDVDATMKDLIQTIHHPRQNQMMKEIESKGNFVNQTCHGMDVEESGKRPRTQAASSQQTLSGSLIETSNRQSCLLNSHLERQGEYQCQNGNTSSRENPLISTKYSRHSTALRLIQRERLALETQKLVLEDLKQKGKLKRVLSGLWRGDPLREQLLSYSNTGIKNWQSTETTLSDSLQPKDRDHTVKSFCSTKVLGTKSVEDKRFYSPTTNISRHYTPLHSKTMESNMSEERRVEEFDHQGNQRQKSALDLTVRKDAGSLNQDADIDMLAKDAENRVMANRRAPRDIESCEFGSRPRYLRHNLWNPDSDPKATVVNWTTSARPLPQPPITEYDNQPALQTIAERPDLFKIITPVKIHVLERLTASHPNRPFVDSVLEGLKSGFWPWAVTNREGYPLVLDESKEIHLTDEKRDFVVEQIKHEQDLECVSKVFG